MRCQNGAQIKIETSALAMHELSPLWLAVRQIVAVQSF
jgi:hypothetical protein